MKTCFVVCQIGLPNSEERKVSDKLYNHVINEVCKNNNYEAVRVDLLNQADRIDSSIINYLETSELVIADLTGHNPNAFFEIGYRIALKKPLIQLISEGQSIPFDVATMRTIFYKITDLDNIAEVKNKLAETIKALDVPSHPIVQNQPTDEVYTNQILGNLFDIKDKLENLTNLTLKKETNIIETIIFTYAKQSNIAPENTDYQLNKLLMTQILENPQKLDNLLKLADKVKMSNQ